MQLAAITGLEAEARIARRAGIEARGQRRGAGAARGLSPSASCDDGVDLLLSFGIARRWRHRSLPGTCCSCRHPR